MSHSSIVPPLANTGLKLLGLAVPLTIMVLLTIMMVQAYNEMVGMDLGGNLEAVASWPKHDTGGILQAALRGNPGSLHSSNI